MIIEDNTIPGGPAITPAVTAGPSTAPAASAVPEETAIDDDIPLGGVDIEDDDVPKGTVTDSAGGKLPQTGESSPMPIYMAGFGLILIGFALNRVFRRNRSGK